MLCRTWIRKIARQTGTLPTNFILQGVKRESEHVVACGGFADVYSGMYAGQKVALKVLRIIVKENQRKIIKVSFSFKYNAYNEVPIKGYNA
jgi:hypothetical protein